MNPKYLAKLPKGKQPEVPVESSAHLVKEVRRPRYSLPVYTEETIDVGTPEEFMELYLPVPKDAINWTVVPKESFLAECSFRNLVSLLYLGWT